MAVLLIAEHDNASIKDATHKALTAAAQMGGDVHVLVAGNNAGAAAAQAAKLDGVKKVLHVDSSTLERPLAEPMAALIVSLAPAYDHIVSPATGNGKNFMPRVAALLDVMQVSDISEVKSADTFVRLIYAGNAVQTVQSTDPKKVITVRTASFPATGEGGSAEIAKVDLIVCLDILPNTATKLATAILPGAGFAEKRGSMVNVKGRLQRLNRATQPPGQARDDWEILCDLLRALGADAPQTLEGVFKGITATVPAFSDLTWAKLGESGIPLETTEALVR